MKEDFWEKYRTYTKARIGMNRAGGSLTTMEMLDFRKDHSLAKDAILAELDVAALSRQITPTCLLLKSRAKNRQHYIQRPDLGRLLDHSSVTLLEKTDEAYDLNLCIADGLSSLAIEKHAVPFLEHLLPLLSAYNMPPISLVSQGRVAISDEIGERWNSKLSVILIGERPGLTSPDSMGAYLTYHPKVGNTDEKRNCLSNIRPGGLPFEYAAQKLSFLISEAIRKKITGVNLKDTFDDQLLK